MHKSPPIQVIWVGCLSCSQAFGIADSMFPIISDNSCMQVNFTLCYCSTVSCWNLSQSPRQWWARRAAMAPLETCCLETTICPLSVRTYGFHITPIGVIPPLDMQGVLVWMLASIARKSLEDYKNFLSLTLLELPTLLISMKIHLVSGCQGLVEAGRHILNLWSKHSFKGSTLNRRPHIFQRVPSFGKLGLQSSILPSKLAR